MTALTIFTPSRNDTFQYRRGSVHIGSEDNLQPDSAHDYAVIILRGRFKVTPYPLHDVPMEMIRVIIPSSPITRVASCSHIDRNMTADVGTYTERDGTRRQSIVLKGMNTTLEELNRWFASLNE